MHGSEPLTDRSHYSTHSHASDSEDEDDKALALEVENAIAALRGGDSNAPGRSPEMVQEEPENEFLAMCAKDIETLQRNTKVIPNAPKVEYKPVELPFSDEIFLKEISMKQQPPVVEPLAQSVDLTALNQVPPKKEEAQKSVPQTAGVRPRAVLSRDQEKEKKQNEMKRLMEEVKMMEEDELSRRVEMMEIRRKFGKYAKKLPRCGILEWVATGDFSLPVSVPATQKAGTVDPDEGFVKYSTQGPAKVTPKMWQELFVVVEPKKPSPDVPDKKPEQNAKKPKEVVEVLEFFANKTSSVGKPSSSSSPPDIVLKNDLKPSSIIISELAIFSHPVSLKEPHSCWADRVVSDQFCVFAGVRPVPLPAFEDFFRESFYRVLPSVKEANPKNPVKASEMAELDALCEQDELNVLDSLPEKAEEIELKLAPQADLTKLAKFVHAKRLFLPMNQLSSLGSVKTLRNLKELYVSQNKIARLDPAVFQQLEDLRILHADVNLLEKIEGLERCQKLEVLKLDNNRIKSVEGLARCNKIRHLNLYRNQITEVSGLEGLVQLQHLDLGRNGLRNVDYLARPAVVPMISELLLYYNEIEQFPPTFSKLLLRSLWLNGNKIQCFSIGWCPLLESLNVSDNSVISMGTLTMAPLLQSVDISFNGIKDVESLLEPFKGCLSLKSIKFNDNPVMKGREGCLNPFIIKLLPRIDEINGENFKPDGLNLVSVSHCANSQTVDRITEHAKFFTAEQAFMNRLIKSEKYKSKNDSNCFTKENPFAEYFLKFAPVVHFNRLLSLVLSPPPKKQIPEYILLRETAEQYAKSVESSREEKMAARQIQSFFRRIRFGRKLRSRKLKKNLGKIEPLEARLRKMMIRRVFEDLTQKVLRKKSRKKTPAECAAKIQGAVRGHLFRMRRKRALENMKKGGEALDDCPEIDVDDFLGKPGKDMDEDDDLFKVPDRSQLEAMIKKIKTTQPVAVPHHSTALPSIASPTGFVKPSGPDPNPSRKTPSSGLPELPPLNQKNLNSLPAAKRIPTGSEISEYEVRSESQRSSQYNNNNNNGKASEPGGKKAMEEVKQKVNNFLAKEKEGLFKEQQEVKEKSKKFAEDWGLKGEDSKKIAEAWMNKKFKRKQAKKVLTPEERFQRFLASKPPAPLPGGGAGGRSKMIPK